jgi:carboxyl-terminal processing protease
MRWWVMGLVLWGSLALAQDTQAFAVRFEQAWRLVKERYYDTSFKGLNWEAIGHAYRQRLGEVRDWDGLYRLLDEMYGELRDDHSRVLSPAEARRLLSGACPCPSKTRICSPTPPHPTLTLPAPGPLSRRTLFHPLPSRPEPPT